VLAERRGSPCQPVSTDPHLLGLPPSGKAIQPAPSTEDTMSATQIPPGDYLIVDGVTLWWRDDDPARIHYTTNSSLFTDANGDRPGIRVVFSSDPLSADYSPTNFNRACRALRAAGKPAPTTDVPEPSRRLRDRLSSALTLRPGYDRP
jgi:hypothetical protein